MAYVRKTNRKTRSNAGIKRGPRKPKVVGPSNVIVVNNGGVAKIEAPTVPKGRGRTVGPMFIGPLRPQNTRRNRKTRSNAGVPRLLGLSGMKIVVNRKTRSNKGVKRGPRTAAGVQRMLNAKYF